MPKLSPDIVNPAHQTAQEIPTGMDRIKLPSQSADLPTLLLQHLTPEDLHYQSMQVLGQSDQPSAKTQMSVMTNVNRIRVLSENQSKLPLEICG